MPGTDFNTTTTREPPAPPAPRGRAVCGSGVRVGWGRAARATGQAPREPAPVVTRLVRWGNSQAVRLPKSVLEQSGVALGDELEVRVQNGAISLQPLHTRTVTIPDFEALFGLVDKKC